MKRRVVGGGVGADSMRLLDRILELEAHWLAVSFVSAARLLGVPLTDDLFATVLAPREGTPRPDSIREMP